MIELENEAESGSHDDIRRTSGNRNENDRADGNPLRSIFFDKSVDEKPPSERAPVSALGVLVLFGGILLPTLAITSALTANVYSACGVLWRHWLETLVQFGLLVSIPAGLGFAWTRIKNNDMRRVRLTGHVIGLALGSSLVAALVTSAAAIMKYPTLDYQGIDHAMEVGWLSIVAWTAVLAAICVAIKFRSQWPTNGAKRSSTVYILIGAAVSILALVASEARATCIRIAEKLVVAGTTEQQASGLNFLRQSNCERDLKLDCSTARAFDLSGMFLRLDNEQYRNCISYPPVSLTVSIS